MSGVAALVRHSLRRWRAFLVALSLLLIVFQVFMILAARGLEKSGGFRLVEALMPAFMEQWTNMMAASFRGFVLFGYFHPIVQLFLVATAIGIGTEPAGEIESKFIDLLMARPVPRSSVITRTLVVLVVVTASAIASMVVATWGGLRLLAPTTARLPPFHVVLSLAANLALLIVAWGGIALAIASWSKRRSTAAAAAGFLAFAMFVLDYVGRFWEPVRTVARISPFHYFDPFAMIGGKPLPGFDLTALTAILLISAVIANLSYQRRDL